MLVFDQEKCRQLSPMSCELVARSENREELVSSMAKNAALEYARQLGFRVSGVSDIIRPYPVGANEESIDDLASGKAPIQHWEAKILMSSGL